MNRLKLAYVKSSCYQDLWVSDKTNNYFEIFKTSMMRCPAIGLSEMCDTDYIIVKESIEYPSQHIPSCCSNKNSMKYSKKNKNIELPYLNEKYHEHCSIDEVSYNVDDVNWKEYNIVITINACIPSRIITLNPHILWCYYVGENNLCYTSKLLDNYDLILNQDVTHNNLPIFSIGFPYSYVGPYTIEKMNKEKLNNIRLQPSITTLQTRQNDKASIVLDDEELIKFMNSPIKKNKAKSSSASCVSSNKSILNKCGIYIELNNTSERPFVNVPSGFKQISEVCKIPIILHDQDILENIKNIYNAKYFVKIYGRLVRGNGILEVISAGTLILINKKLIMYNNLIPDICHVETPDDVINKILFFENNPIEYNKVIEFQRNYLNEYYFKKPFENLINKYKIKISLCLQP
jgi:hypothetical protein